MLNWEAIHEGADPINDPTFNPGMMAAYKDNQENVGYEVDCVAMALALLRNVGMVDPSCENPVLAIDHMLNVNVQHIIKMAEERGINDRDRISYAVAMSVKRVLYGMFIIAYEAYDDYSMFRRAAIDKARPDWSDEKITEYCIDPDNGVCCAFHVAEKMLMELGIDGGVALGVFTEKIWSDGRVEYGTDGTPDESRGPNEP